MLVCFSAAPFFQPFMFQARMNDMFGIGKGFFGGLIGLFFFSIIVFFVIYFLVPDVSIRFFGISVNSDEYVDESISQSLEAMDLPEGILTELQDYFTSEEGKQYLENASDAVGNGADQVISFVKSDNFRNIADRAGEVIASGAQNVSDYFSSLGEAQ